MPHQPVRERIAQATAEHAGQTLRKLKERLETTLNVSTLCTALKAMKLTLK